MRGRAISTPGSGRASIAPSAGSIRVPRDRTPLTRSSETGKESNEAGCPHPADLVCVLSARVAVPEKVLLDSDGLARTLSRIAHEIIEANPDLTQVALVGIQTRG